jgi:hypothetical protein
VTIALNVTAGMILARAVVFVCTWVGSTLLVGAWMSRGHRPSLAERLAPFRPRPVAEEAQEWLRRQ